MRIIKSLCVAIVAVAILAAFLFLRRSQDPRPQNLVLITFDALRADRLGCYGYLLKTSPHIDSLARGGVLFSQAFSVSPLTPVSLASLLTSTYPDRNNVYNFGFRINERTPSLQSILKERGFSTAAAGGNGWLQAMVRGLGDTFDLTIDASTDDLSSFKPYLDWVIAQRGRRFFLWVHLKDQPHAPYDAPEPFKSMFLSSSPEGGDNLDVVEDHQGFGGLPAYMQKGAIASNAYYRAQYDAEVAFADAMIGDFIRELRKRDIMRKTLIIISSDHGEDLGEHGYYFSHGCTLYDQAIRVPLILFAEGFLPLDLRIAENVRSIDIMPTALEILGVPRPKGLEGVSLLPSILWPGTTRKQDVFSYTGKLSYFNGKLIKNTQIFSLRSAGWKLISAEKSPEELYFLEDDPRESNNLAAGSGETILRLREKLRGFRDRWKLMDAKLADIVLPDKYRERLQDLHYIQ